MGTRLVEVYICDRCGAELESAPEPTIVGWRGQAYSLDLCQVCQDADSTALDALVEPASKVEPWSAARPKARAPKQRVEANGNGDLDRAEARRWALDNGFEVSDRGRLPQDVVAAFRKAHRRRRAA